MEAEFESVTIKVIPTISETNNCHGCIWEGHSGEGYCNFKEAMIILGLEECSDGFIYIIKDKKESNY